MSKIALIITSILLAFNALLFQASPALSQNSEISQQAAQELERMVDQACSAVVERVYNNCLTGSGEPISNQLIERCRARANNLNPEIRACRVQAREGLPTLDELIAEIEAGKELETATPGTSSVNPSARPNTVRLKNPIEGNPSIQQLLGNIVTAVLGVVGSLTLLAFIYGGFMWLTSAGNPDRVKKGTNTMLYSVIGLFIIFSAYAILNTIISGLRSSASPTTGIPETPDTSCIELFGAEGFQCLPVADCAGLPAGARWQDCRNAPAGVCKVNRCGEAAGVVCCKPKS